MNAFAQPTPSTARFQITIGSGVTEQTLALDEGQSWLIGRSATCAVRLDDPSVSRRHAQLHPQLDRVEIEDLGSVNGTWVTHPAGALGSLPVNGEQRLGPYVRTRLRVGELVRVGGVSIRLGWAGSLEPLRARAADLPATPVLVDPVMHGVHCVVQRAARLELSLLIIGEPGVGKQLFAQLLHRSSPRAAGPFSIINCAALPERFLEGELFGREAGASPDTHPGQAGLLEESHGGTLFLDEIGELPLGMQAKLLRALEERRVSRVGSKEPRAIDVRIITATSRDLLAEVRSGQFRGDLYYRISGLSVRIPPLRERPTELEPLARHFIERASRATSQPAPELTRGALLALQQHSWPGNARELGRVIERAVRVAHAGVIDEAHIQLDQPAFAAESHSEAWDVPTRVDAVRETPRRGPDPLERERLVAALDACAGNQRRAAELLGVSRRTLVNRLNKWKLPRPRKKEPLTGDEP